MENRKCNDFSKENIKETQEEKIIEIDWSKSINII